MSKQKKVGAKRSQEDSAPYPRLGQATGKAQKQDGECGVSHLKTKTVLSRVPSAH